MADKSKNTLFGLLPAICGIASVLAAFFAYGMIWMIFNQGPGGPLNNMAGAALIWLPVLFGCVSGLVGVNSGISHKKWIGGVIAAVGTALNGFLVFLLFAMMTR